MKKRRKKKHKSKRKISYGILLAVALILGFSIVSFQHPSNDDVGSSNKAAIVDHLSLSIPNQTFVNASITILKNAGYAVDYYKGEEVTVDFYRNLATHGYVLIVLRVHSALYEGVFPHLALFTSEPYSKTKYTYEQLTDQLSYVGFYADPENKYFGIRPGFIRHMNGKFHDTIIIMMGCEGLKNLGPILYTDMAEAFIKKGTKSYISWSGSVLGGHTDCATIHLLQHLITQKQTVKDAVTATMEEVGPDPQYKTWLLYYPVSES